MISVLHEKSEETGAGDEVRILPITFWTSLFGSKNMPMESKEKLATWLEQRLLTIIGNLDLQRDEFDHRHKDFRELYEMLHSNDRIVRT